MFILELTLRSWNHSEENKRRTLQRNDIAAAITRTDIFDFLVHSCGQLPLLAYLLLLAVSPGWVCLEDIVLAAPLLALCR